MFPRLWCATSLLFLLLLCLLILEELIVYQVGLIPSKYYTVLGNRDNPGFRTLTIYSILIVASIAFVKATGNYVSSLLYVTWREYIISNLHKLYFKNMNYYNINVLEDKLDNPDQRITQDLDKMCNEFSAIIAKVIISPFKVAYYTYRAWTTAGALGPLSVYGFFAVSTVFNKFLMSPVVNLVYQQEKREGDLRFKHMQIRVNAEGVAFYRGGELERCHTDQIYNKLLRTQQRLVLWEYPLNFAVNAADYIGSILSYIIVGIPILMGDYSDLSPVDISSLISQNSFFIMYLINCFTQLIDLSVKVVDVAGTTHRVSQLIEKLLRIGHKEVLKRRESESDVTPPLHTSTSLTHISKALDVKHLTYGPPNSQTVLVRDLDMQVVAGCNILITGVSGCGKSSLLRIISGLWPSFTGTVDWDLKQGELLYLPQKPYFTDGSLRTQICFPLHGAAVNDEETIQEYLRIAGLWSLHERTLGLDTQIEWNWYDMLSPGEMQRLSFVRLFYHSPPFAILDEATSQLDVDMERVMYEQCAQLGITLVSVGHRETLQQYHQMKIHLNGDGSWSTTLFRL